MAYSRQQVIETIISNFSTNNQWMKRYEKEESDTTPEFDAMGEDEIQALGEALIKKMIEEAEGGEKTKFENPNHDKSNGQFTSGGGSSKKNKETKGKSKSYEPEEVKTKAESLWSEATSLPRAVIKAGTKTVAKTASVLEASFGKAGAATVLGAGMIGLAGGSFATAGVAAGVMAVVAGFVHHFGTHIRKQNIRKTKEKAAKEVLKRAEDLAAKIVETKAAKEQNERIGRIAEEIVTKLGDKANTDALFDEFFVPTKKIKEIGNEIKDELVESEVNKEINKQDNPKKPPTKSPDWVKDTRRQVEDREASRSEIARRTVDRILGKRDAEDNTGVTEAKRKKEEAKQAERDSKGNKPPKNGGSSSDSSSGPNPNPKNPQPNIGGGGGNAQPQPRPQAPGQTAQGNWDSPYFQDMKELDKILEGAMNDAKTAKTPEDKDKAAKLVDKVVARRKQITAQPTTDWLGDEPQVKQKVDQKLIDQLANNATDTPDDPHNKHRETKYPHPRDPNRLISGRIARGGSGDADTSMKTGDPNFEAARIAKQKRVDDQIAKSVADYESRYGASTPPQEEHTTSRIAPPENQGGGNAPTPPAPTPPKPSEPVQDIISEWKRIAEAMEKEHPTKPVNPALKKIQDKETAKKAGAAQKKAEEKKQQQKAQAQAILDTYQEAKDAQERSRKERELDNRIEDREDFKRKFSKQTRIVIDRICAINKVLTKYKFDMAGGYAMPGGSNTFCPQMISDKKDKHKIRFDNEEEFETWKEIAVFDMHNGAEENLDIDFNEEMLNKIVERCNERIEDTGDNPVVIAGHTEEGEEGSERDVLGFASNFVMGDIGNVKPRKCIYCDLHIKKDCVERAKQLPRRSIELWTSDWVADPIVLSESKSPIDCVSLLGSTRPARDLGLMFERNVKIKFSRQNIKEFVVQWYQEWKLKSKLGS